MESSGRTVLLLVLLVRHILPHFASSEEPPNFVTGEPYVKTAERIPKTDKGEKQTEFEALSLNSNVSSQQSLVRLFEFNDAKDVGMKLVSARLSLPRIFSHMSAVTSLEATQCRGCAADAIYVKLRTNRTFEGHVHVKFASNKYCYQTLVTNNQIEVLVPHEECAVPRRRSKTPSGVFLETSLAVAFHPDFTTADDRIFHFRCFHQRTSQELQGAGSPTEPPRESAWNPSCSYTVRKWPNGPLVGTVVLGQTVFHQWSCENEKDNCLIVRSCSVVAAEKAHELIGADGCSKNTKILPHLSYFGPSLVGQNVSVFGVSQTSLIYFECELLLIPKQNGVCDVPTCAESDGNRTRRSFDDHPSISVDVQSQRIEVSELGVISDVEVDSMQSVELTCHEKASYPVHEICVPFNPFFVFLAGMISVTFFVISTAAMVSFQRYRHYSMSQTRC
ncbi:hypothetical protein RB195_019158 [Necator americanus]|uniref:ZP domain-containing protein n=1 Tax=Necator americanus TaxID=51031 RepID=A0ABR1CFI3_NECAM